MDYANERKITVEINFPYFKQGDDFGHCLGDLESFIKLHQNVINRAQEILNAIPVEAKPYVTGDGDTHCCFLTGPQSVMEQLVKEDLATRDEDHDEESDHYDYSQSDGEDENTELPPIS